MLADAIQPCSLLKGPPRMIPRVKRTSTMRAPRARPHETNRHINSRPDTPVRTADCYSLRSHCVTTKPMCGRHASHARGASANAQHRRQTGAIASVRKQQTRDRRRGDRFAGKRRAIFEKIGETGKAGVEKALDDSVESLPGTTGSDEPVALDRRSSRVLPVKNATCH